MIFKGLSIKQITQIFLEGESPTLKVVDKNRLHHFLCFIFKNCSQFAGMKSVLKQFKVKTKYFIEKKISGKNFRIFLFHWNQNSLFCEFILSRIMYCEQILRITLCFTLNTKTCRRFQFGSHLFHTLIYSELTFGNPTFSRLVVRQF